MVSPREQYRRFPGVHCGALHGTYRRDFAIVFRADMPSARFREPRGNSRWRASRVLFGGDLCTVSSRAGLALNTFSIRSRLKYPDPQGSRDKHRRSHYETYNAIVFLPRAAAKSRSGQLTLTRVMTLRGLAKLE